MNTAHHSPLGSTAEHLHQRKKIVALSLIPLPVLVILGILGYQKGWIVGAIPEANTPTLSLQPPDAHLKDFDHENKYATNSAELTVSGSLLDETAAQNSQAITGQPSTSDAWGENSVPTAPPTAVRSATVQKNELLGLYQQAQTRTIAKQNAEIQAIYKPSYSVTEEDPTTKAANEELVKTLRYNNQLLEKQVKGEAPPHSVDLEQWRQALKNRVNQYRDFNGDTIINPVIPEKSSNPLKLSSDRVVIQSAHARNGFYGLGGKKIDTGISNPNADQTTIPAVIHGDGELVKIENGSSIWIRLTEETVLQIGQQPLKLPTHTLLSGICSIGNERVKIVVQNVRIGNTIYPLQLTAHDLDGKEGLFVPKLQEKNKIAQAISQSATSSASPYMFLPQGSIGQQVGTQVAIQAASTGFNVARGIVQQKLAQPNAIIRANYRIFLRTRN